jgi:hypothetical protein
MGSGSQIEVAVLLTALFPATATGEDNGGLKTTGYFPALVFSFFLPASAVMLKLG